VSDPNPVRIAAAIADLARDTVCDAWHYLDAVERLGAREPESPVGIQPLELRHALERPRDNTEAMRAMDHWVRAGARGLLSIVGKVGRGKSHAAACWALDRGRDFKDTLWLACASWPAAKEQSAERAALIRRAQHASALVLDDLGAGSSSAPWVAEHFEGPLISRVGRFAPTVIITNKSKAELKDWLGGRLWDRLAYAGGVVEVPGCDACKGTKLVNERKCTTCDGSGAVSMRKRDDTPLDEQARSTRWLTCARLVGVIGCELVDGRLVVGRALEQEAARVGNGVNVYAAELLGLDRDAVRARAALLEQRDRELVAKEGLDVDVSGGITFAALVPALALRIVENQAEEAAAARARADDIERAKLELMPVRVDLDAHVTPAALASAKSLASAWRVRCIEHDDHTWAVRRCDGQMLAVVPTEALAYYHAALSIRARMDGQRAEQVEATA
jgi:hypothetical protein